MTTRAAKAAWVLLAMLAALASGNAAPAGAAEDAALEDWRMRQVEMRAAVRDTAGHADDANRLAHLAEMLTESARTREAGIVWRQVLALRPADAPALAALGRIALVEGRAAEAESLFVRAEAAGPDETLARDRLAASVARGDWAAAAKLADAAGQSGRVELFEHLATNPPYRIAAGPDSARLAFAKSYPVPLVRVIVGGERLLFALDTGTSGALLDASAARRLRVREVGGAGTVSWLGGAHEVKWGVVPALEIAGFRVENVPVAMLSLRKYSIVVHPHSEVVAGVLGVDFLRAFVPTLDHPKMTLVLRRPEAAPAFAAPDAADAVPFETWGEGELVVRGRIADSRALALWVATGFPECAVAAPAATFEELRIKPGAVSRVLRGASSALSGHPWARVKVPSLEVGPLRAAPADGWSGALDEAAVTRHGMRRDGAVGHDAFKGLRVTFDWNARVLRLHAAK